MTHFRKKPVVIEAEQLTEQLAWAMLAHKKAGPFGVLASGSWHEGDGKLHQAWVSIKTMEGVMRADLGDWIIKGVKGEIYPCKPDIFAATYDEIPTPPLPTEDERQAEMGSSK